METLFAALTQYIDFLVLGAIALPVLCLPFGLVKPLEAAWTGLSCRVRRNHTFIQAGLLAGVLFAVLYFTGYFLNAVGHTFLRGAHYSVIDTAATFDPFDPKQEPRRTGWWSVRLDFMTRTIPIIGPFLWPHDKSEVDNYWRDATRQIYWDTCDSHSFDDLTGGGALKELRLLRGLAGLAQILLGICLLSPLLRRLKYVDVPDQVRWSKHTFVAALIVYEVLIVPAYWDAEYDEHSTIWSAVSQKHEPTTANMDSFLPCAKMKIVAAGNESATHNAGTPKNNGQTP